MQNYTDIIKYDVGVLLLKTNKPVPFSHTKYIRGYVINHFENHFQLHNHMDEKFIYDYPRIQYKVIGQQPVIVGIGEKATHLLEDIGKQITKLELNHEEYAIQEIDFYAQTHPFGISDTPRKYLLQTPTLLLNQQNYKKYKSMSLQQQNDFLAKNISNQILSVAKRLHYRVPDKIVSTHQLETVESEYKKNKMLGFVGYFQTNFHIPHLISIGKGVSKGYGCCVQLEV